MRRNQSIDLLKFISIIFIVIIHNRFTSYFGFAMDAIARFSVPTFFITTGYFIIQTNNISVKLKQQIVKLTKYYVLYEFIYILYNFAIAVLTNKLKNFEKSFVTNLKYILIDPTIGGHLWYVINIIWVLIIIYIFNYFGKLKSLFISSMILHLIGIIISHLSFQLFNRVLNLYITRNFLFFGLFYVMVGTYIGKCDINKIKISKSIILTVSISTCLFQVIEKYIWQELFNSHFVDYYVTTIFASVGIFIYALKCNINNLIVEKISNYSMPIYFFHILVMSVFNKFIILFFHIIHVDVNIIKGTIVGNFAFILGVCIFTCILFDISKNLVQLLLNKKIKSIKLNQ